MAYASVAQAEHDPVYRNSSEFHDLTGHSPILPEISSPPLSLPFDQLSGDGDHSAASQNGPGSVGVGSLLKSLSSSQSYQMVEDDDYEEPMPTPRGLELKMEDPSLPRDGAVPSHSEEPPIRTASISRHLPLNHPTPDLQSLQGAFVKNVERLEESAERLSMTSSLEDELHKMKQDQRRLERQSSAPAALNDVLRPALHRQYSWSNSIIGVNQAARTGGYSPAGYITSPTGSIRSGPRSHQQQIERRSSKSSRRDHPLPEPPLEGRPLDFSSTQHESIPMLPEEEPPLASPVVSHSSIQEERPLTSASNDTYRQAQSAFNDFDGVHYISSMSNERAASIPRRISLKQPPLARDSKAYREPQPGERMIYYPAPVPVMLNLPQRLSKVNFGEQEKRRLQALSGIPDEMRKSAAWLLEQDATKVPNQRSSLNLPPQLRASAFFEQPGVAQDLELKNGSAVQTLDSILDAAAHAPVSAFIDHPIVGQLGKEVYGPNASPRKSMQLADAKAKKRRSSLSTMLKTRRSSTGLTGARLNRKKSKEGLSGDEYASGDELERAAAESIAPDADEISDHDGDGDGDGDEEVTPGFSTAPTTLLAELQMRKEQQKLRNRTAADAFPNGMHSTLLELDAVTQLQQRARKTKHVTLAWEDHDQADKQNFDDEDVPLGVLFPEKDRADHVNAHRPIGLLEKRELEDNEPLSHRRARLRGEPIQPTKTDTKSEVDEESRAPFIEDVPGLVQDALPEDEEETLAQRAARIKLEKEKGTAGQFGEELASELGLNVGTSALHPSKTPDGEETLAQRRTRLKEEAVGKPPLRSMHSLADVLQAHPVGLQSRQVSNEPKRPIVARWQTQGPPLNHHGNPALAATNSLQAANWGYAQLNGAYNGNAYQNNMPYVNGGFSGSTPALYGAPLPMHMQQAMGAYPYAYGNQRYLQDPMMGPPLDPKQRAQIDRWRQSVVQ